MSRPSLERVALALFAVALFGSLIFTVHPWYDLASSDSGLYVATARALAEGEGYTHLGRPFTNRPPGFSALLAPLVATRGVDFWALNVLVSAFGAVGVVLLALFARPRLGVPLALLCATAVWLAPAYQRLCNQVLSDVPGVALLFASLLVERWAVRAPSWRREVLLGVCIGVAAYLRAAMVLLVPAIALSRGLALPRGSGPRIGWLDFGLRRVALFAAIAFVLLLPWNVHVRQVVPPSPADQTGAYSYWTALVHEDPGDPQSPLLGAKLLERVPARAGEIVGMLGSGLTATQASPARAFVALLLVAGLGWVLVRRREPAELFAAGTLLLLLFYFDLRERLLLPVLLIAFPAAVECLRDLARRWGPERAATPLAAVAVVLTIAFHAAPRGGWAEIEEKHTAFAAVCDAVSSALDAEARLATSFNWHYGVCLDRPVYSLIFAVRRGRSPAAAEAVIDRYGVDTVVLTPIWVLDQSLFPYFAERYGKPVDLGEAVLFRVRDPAGKSAPLLP
jgi:4-amino-4-deoxy-L-arabinose transferase-like glycosyltransferase